MPERVEDCPRCHLVALRESHVKGWRSIADEVHCPDLTAICLECRHPWPCDVVRLADELENAHKVLIFADGVAVSNTNFALYAEDCEWAQSALTAARCHPRGSWAKTLNGEPS